MKKEKKRIDELKDVAINTKASDVKATSERTKYQAKTDRKKYDDLTKRKKFKDEEFGKNKTIKDPYTDSQLHKSTKAAKNKYGKNYNKHTAQTDHTVSIEKVANSNRDNVFLSEKDIKEIANIEANYKLINGNLNQSKGGKTNIQTAKNNNVGETQKKRMAKTQIKAEIAVEGETIKRTLKGAHKVGSDAAKNGAIVGGTVSTVQNVGFVIKGEEDIPEAVVNIAVDTAKSAGTSYVVAVGTKGAEGLAKSIGHKVKDQTIGKAAEKVGEQIGTNLVKFAESNELGKVVVVTLEVGSSVKKYLEGYISGEELVLELGDKGTALATSFACGAYGAEIGAGIGAVAGTLTLPGGGTIGFAALGAVAGEIIGNMIGYMIGSEVYNTIVNFWSDIDSERAKEEIKKYKALSKQIEQYRKNLEKICDEVRMKNKKNIIASFAKMREGIINDDAEMVTDALSRICELYGEEIKFKTNEEFLEFWNNPDSVMLI